MSGSVPFKKTNEKTEGSALQISTRPFISDTLYSTGTLSFTPRCLPGACSFLNLLVYWQLRCVLLLLCFQFHACFLLIGLPGCVCVQEGKVMLCIPPSSRSLHLWGPSQSGSTGPWLNALEKPEVTQERKGWSPERQEGGWWGLWVKEGGLHAGEKSFVCWTAFPLLARSLPSANRNNCSHVEYYSQMICFLTSYFFRLILCWAPLKISPSSGAALR